MKMKYLLVLLALVTSCNATIQPSSIRPISLRCEYLENPSVVDVSQPRLDWINSAAEGIRGQTQTAYEIKVASSIDLLQNPDLWTSGKVDSDQSIRINYAGKPLISRQECWWQVRVWDKDGNPSEWSEPAFWRMGLLNQTDWQAKWIGAPWQGEEALPKPSGPPQARPEQFSPPAPLLRKAFRIEKDVEKAVAFVTGLGYFEFYVNGKKVGDDVLVPNQTNYGKRPGLTNALINVEDNFRRYKVMYLAYDIKSLLTTGDNVIGGILGNGFYNPAKFWAEAYGSPRFLGQIHITYTDGTEEIIVSDETWKASKSPILMNMVYYGEYYDAREEQDGWSTSDFNEASWENVVQRKAPEGNLVAHTAHPDKVTEQIKPVSIEKLENGNYKVDFGVEISGWVRLNNVTGPAGHQIEIAFNGNEYSGDNTYIFRGDGVENYAPRFNWFVFSGIEIKNWPGDLKAENLTAEAVNTYVERSSTFETSNQLLNEINKIWQRSQLDNMHGGIASDCPHRERSAYTGDGQVSSAMVMENFDARNFYYKWIQDIQDAQNMETGYVPNGAPWQPGCGGGVAWGAAICIMPWEFYIHYGDKDVLESNYDGMKGYIRYMKTWVDDDGIMFSKRTAANGEILKWYNLGEWVAPGEMPPDDMVHTFYYWMCADIASKTATILENRKEAETYSELAEKTKKAFQLRFYDSEHGTFGNAGGNIFALKMGLTEEQYPKVIEALKQNIKSNKGHFDTGIFGTRYFFEVLAANGMQDLAYEALTKTDEPSFGHWIELGSTTTREQWSEEGSHNHPMFGGGLVWLYQNLAGMQIDPQYPAYKRIIFKPQPVDQLDFVRYKNNTPYGDTGIYWHRENGKFVMEVTVPIGCSAEVFVPARNAEQVLENNKTIEDNINIKFDRMDGGYAVFIVDSGHYLFSV